MFPLRDFNPRRKTPVATIGLIAIIVIVWLVTQGAGSGYAFAHSLCELGMIPGELTGRAIGEVTRLDTHLVCIVDPAPAWHTVLTSMFLHGGWFHLIGNVWFLWLFGDNVEDRLGHAGFVVFYLVCGIVAAMTQLAVDPASPVPMVGASGAISGVMGAYVVMFPYAPVRIITLVIVFPLVFHVPAIFMLGFWFVLQLLGALPQLGDVDAGVAFWAHVGGFVAGVVIALFRRRDQREPEPPRPVERAHFVIR